MARSRPAAPAALPCANGRATALPGTKFCTYRSHSLGSFASCIAARSNSSPRRRRRWGALEAHGRCMMQSRVRRHVAPTPHVAYTYSWVASSVKHRPHRARKAHGRRSTPSTVALALIAASTVVLPRWLSHNVKALMVLAELHKALKGTELLRLGSRCRVYFSRPRKAEQRGGGFGGWAQKPQAV
jgi:hypothetical protein